MTVVLVRLSDDEVRKLNILMKRRLYRSRNEAVREILAEGLEARLSEDEDVTSIVSKMLALKKHRKNPVSFKSERSVIQIIAEGRN